MKRLTALIASNTFFYAMIGLIIACCLFFAVSITYRVPSDEFFHFDFIQFYSNQPVLNGPFITDQGTEYFELRDITRTPNYLYHYGMSFVQRLTELFTDSLFTQVFVLRLVTIAIGIASLFVVRRILRQVKASPLAINLTIMLLGLTGMLLWLFASVNYDVPAILLYLAVISVALSILQGKHITTKRLVLFVTLAMLCVLTKVTFAPFLAILVGITLILKRRDLRVIQNLSLRKWKHIGLLLVFVVTGLLFIERIGGNIVMYQQIEVDCDKIHAYADCMQDDVFRRNETQLQVYAQQKAAGNAVSYNPIEFTQGWLTLMYERIHFYFGHQQMVANYGAKVLAAVIGTVMVGLALVFRKKLLANQGEKLLFWVTVSYGLVMYIFNLQTYLKFGQFYAFQGRYLLPVIPFFLYFCVKLLLLTYRSLGKQWRPVFLTVVGALFVFSVYTHLPILVFYRGTEPKWWPAPMESFNLQVQDSLKSINIKPLL